LRSLRVDARAVIVGRGTAFAAAVFKGLEVEGVGEAFEAAGGIVALDFVLALSVVIFGVELDGSVDVEVLLFAALLPAAGALAGTSTVRLAETFSFGPFLFLSFAVEGAALA